MKKVATLQSKAEVWDKTNRQYPVDPKFFWIQHDCTPIHPTQMRTAHLFHSLKMIWNNSVPERYKIPPVRKWGGIPTMEPLYKRQAVANLFNELMNRPDRTEGMEEALRTMAKVIVEEGLNIIPRLRQRK